MKNKKEGKMKEYEVVHEIFNECANNQMRDVFFEEVMMLGNRTKALPHMKCTCYY